jgi:uncharacterized membrane protein
MGVFTLIPVAMTLTILRWYPLVMDGSVNPVITLKIGFLYELLQQPAVCGRYRMGCC